MEHIKPPRSLDLEASNLPHEWRRWKEEFEFYLDLVMDVKDESKKIKLFKYLVGEKGRELCTTLLSADKTLKEVLAAFSEYLESFLK